MRRKEVLATMERVLSHAALEFTQRVRAIVTRDVIVEEHQRRGRTVLLVEDNATNRRVAELFLERAGCAVVLAADGREALEALRGQLVDLVLMDVQMPVMDGYRAAAAIRHGLGLATLPIIAMTATTMPGDREASLAAGMNDHVGKPFDLRELVATLLHHTGRATAPEPVAPLPVATASSAVLDMETAIHRMGGNRTLYHRLVPSFLKDAQDSAARAPLLLAEGRREEASRLLHTLKGLAGTMGASDLQAAAAAAEKALAGPASPADGPAIQALQAAVAQAAQALSAAMPAAGADAATAAAA
jgi:CheY-like chemotaxis protein